VYACASFQSVLIVEIHRENLCGCHSAVLNAFDQCSLQPASYDMPNLSHLPTCAMYLVWLGESPQVTSSSCCFVWKPRFLVSLFSARTWTRLRKQGKNFPTSLVRTQWLLFNWTQVSCCCYPWDDSVKYYCVERLAKLVESQRQICISLFGCGIFFAPVPVESSNRLGSLCRTRF